MVFLLVLTQHLQRLNLARWLPHGFGYRTVWRPPRRSDLFSLAPQLLQPFLARSVGGVRGEIVGSHRCRYHTVVVAPAGVVNPHDVGRSLARRTASSSLRSSSSSGRRIVSDWSSPLPTTGQTTSVNSTSFRRPERRGLSAQFVAQRDPVAHSVAQYQGLPPLQMLKTCL